MTEPGTTPEITILITAHNEADQIQACLQAIMAQDYPMERVEIILVDDRSTDGTAALAEQMRIEALRVIRIDQKPEKLTARQAAIDAGLTAARGELVLLTDAGGRVPREWIRELAGHIGYRDGGVSGPVVFAGARRVLASYQTLDALVLFSLYNWEYRHKKGGGLFAANLALNPEAYREIGGFAATGFAPLEDVALGGALAKAGWSLRFLNQPAVQNPACESIGELCARARRLARGHARGVTTVLLAMIFGNLLLTGAWLWWGGLWKMILLLRWGIGVLWIGFVMRRYPVYTSWLSILIYEPVMTALGLHAYLTNLVQPRWRWGGVEYDKQGPARN